MQYVLHITKRCNFRCDYCPQVKNDADMELSVAMSIVDLAFDTAQRQGEHNACLSFYGGEPLLCKSLIRAVVTYANDRYGPQGFRFRYRMTTNGALLDDEFLDFAAQHGFRIALSIDGTKCAHDLHRRKGDGSPTHDGVLRAGRALLSGLPGSTAMATVNPDTAPMLFESVRYLYGLGFRQIVTALNHLAPWTEEDMRRLSEQYTLLAGWYGDMLLRGETIRLPLFDAKFVGFLTPEIDREKCAPGNHRLSFDVSGNIYPCIQYVNFPEYRLGDATSGLHQDKLEAVRQEALLPIQSCAACALNTRCDNHCGCKNLETTGSVRGVSPVVCAHERMLIPIVDALGSRIFK